MSLDQRQQRLFVEGPNDGAVVNKLVWLRLHQDMAKPGVRIVDAPAEEGGFDSALERFRSALEAKRPARLALVVDRDGVDGKPDRWPAVRDILTAAGLDAPPMPSSEGLHFVTTWGRVGVWLMPDNVRLGDLETFLEDLLPPPSPVWEHAAESTQEAKRRGAPYRDVHASKARFHTWLAWQDPPGQPYGTAIGTHTLGAQSSAADAFVGWFERLFLAD